MIHENIVIDDIDQAVHVVEPLVDLVRLIGFRKKPCTHVLQQDHIELHNCMGGTVILLHHVFAGTAGIERLAVFPEIKGFGNRTWTSNSSLSSQRCVWNMQADTDVLECLFRFFNCCAFRWSQKSTTGELVP